jgi:transposase
MNEPKIIITMKDIQKYKVIESVVNKKLTGIEAAKILDLTNVHVSRLKKRFLIGGFESLLRKPRLVPPNKKIANFQIQQIIKFRKDLYYDFNINHFNEKLHEIHNIKYSYTSIRTILLNAELHVSKKKKIIHRLRRRMPKTGMLIQMDSSQHHWLPAISDKWWLIAMIDDANNEVSYAKFFPSDTLFANMHVIRTFIEKKGLFVSLYTDKASHFKTTRKSGIHYNVNPEQDDTQIQRALDELGITLILANSPQAKGRVERLFGTFQDRLIHEMRLAKICNYDQANKFLIECFLPDYNERFSIENIDSAYSPIPADITLDTVFCVKLQRSANSDNTIQVQGQTIQIPPSKYHRSFAHRKVDVCILDDNRILVLYNNKIILQTILSKNYKIYKKNKKLKEILNLREYFNVPRKKYIPPPDHPWRKFKISKNHRSLYSTNV